MANILVLNGPNLNLLGIREPEIYGTTSLAEINTRLLEIARQSGHNFSSFQSNAEHELIAHIHEAMDHFDFIIINPGAFTHTSIALRDALAGVRIPFIEVHLANIYAREPFRAHSYFSDIAAGVITGLGPLGYELALQAAIVYCSQQ